MIDQRILSRSIVTNEMFYHWYSVVGIERISEESTIIRLNYRAAK